MTLTEQNIESLGTFFVLLSELDTDLSSAAIDPSAASADTTNHHHQKNNIIHQRPSQLNPTQPSTLVKREETTTARIPGQ